MAHLILMIGLRERAEGIIIEYRADGDKSNWPVWRKGSPAEVMVDDEFDEAAIHHLSEVAPPGVCGVFYYPRAGEAYCEMYPPAKLWPAIRDRFLTMANSSPCPAGPRAGNLTLRFAHRPQASFYVEYEIDDGERLLIKLLRPGD